nr:MAG TPA: hypothetical protein [Caudoviricetes sp.]
MRHFKNGIFCTEEGNVPIPEHYIPRSKIKGVFPYKISRISLRYP